MCIKLKANRQTGGYGVRAPTHWRSASVVGKDEDLLPRRSAAIIGVVPRRISRAAFRDQQGGIRDQQGGIRDQQGGSANAGRVRLRRRATRSTRRNAQKIANEMCLCVQSSRL